MYSSIETCTLVGFEAHAVTCEIHLANQLPSVSLVGLPSSITQESRERVRAAVVNSGLEWPARKVTINLVPATLPKWGSHFELAMALGILLAGKELPSLFAVGELSLSGEIKPCGWAALLCPVLRAVQVVVANPKDIQDMKAALVNDEEYIFWIEASRLSEAIEKILSFLESGPKKRAKNVDSVVPDHQKLRRDFTTLEQVKDEPLAILAALCALKRRYHALFAGSHGVGKSMIVRGITDALLPLSTHEQNSRSLLAAMFGDASIDWTQSTRRPIVRLQSGVTKQSIEGSLLDSGRVLSGELTRAHCGVLVADEFLELRRDVIESFRQPIEEKCVRMSRAKLKTSLPADFQLLATTNLCPCGYLGHSRRKCRCVGATYRRYLAKLSGPILDRFDLIVLMGQGLTLKTLRERLLTDQGLERLLFLADSSKWETALANPQRSYGTLEISVEHRSPRARQKISDVANTIAGLCAESVGAPHVELAKAIRADLDWEVRREGSFAS